MLIERTKEKRKTKLMKRVLRCGVGSEDRSGSNLRGKLFIFVCLYLPFTKLGTVRHFEHVKPFPGMRTKCKIVSAIILLGIDVHRSLLFLEFFLVSNFISTSHTVFYFFIT
jgi:hypothetical protein